MSKCTSRNISAIARINLFYSIYLFFPSGRSQWPRGLRRASAAARLLRLWVLIPPGGMGVCLSVVSVECYQIEGSATS
jgi:hypothetical protein